MTLRLTNDDAGPQPRVDRQQKRLARVAMRLFLVVNGAHIRLADPVTGDEFVRAVAQGQTAEIAARFEGWRVE